MRHRFLLRLAVMAFIAGMGAAPASFAATEAEHPKQLHWPFDGMFGTVDVQSAQRGYQVYKEVCAACHSMKRVPFRSLGEIGFTEAEIKALAAGYSYEELGDDGQPKERPGRPSDYFKSPYPNEKASRAANGGAYPPDLSLIVKARHDGANYVYSLLTGYASAPSGMKMADGMHYNPYFPGGQIAMPSPLSEGQVSYGDGTASSVDQMSRDVVNFLQWAAEPEMQHRKAMGLKVLMFLLIMTGFSYVAKKRVWNRLK